MPSFDDFTPGKRVLLLGEPGSGKTSAIGKLAEAGQKIFFCDFDNNLNPVAEYVAPQHLKNIQYVTLTDKKSLDEKGKVCLTSPPTAFKTFCRLSRSWVDPKTGEDFGPPDNWPSDHWMVVDTTGSLAETIMNQVMWDRKKRDGQQRSKFEWMSAINTLEGTIHKYQGSRVNIIWTAHLSRLSLEDITETADDEGKLIDKPTEAKRLPPNAHMRYPVCMGQKLPPRFGGYFNIILEAQRIGEGAGARRVIRTVPELDVDIKVPLKKRLPPDVKIDQLWEILKHFK